MALPMMEKIRMTTEEEIPVVAEDLMKIPLVDY